MTVVEVLGRRFGIGRATGSEFDFPDGPDHTGSLIVRTFRALRIIDSTTHQQLTLEEQASSGVTPDFVRLLVGTEDVEDLIDDLKQALDAV